MKFVSLGNVCLDRILRYAKDIPRWGTEIFFEESEDRPAGQGANFSMALSRLGQASIIFSNIGNDTASKSILSKLRKLPRIDSKFLRRTNSTTGFTVSIVRTDGERSFLSHLGHQSIFSIMKDRDQVLRLISTNDIVHISGFFMMPLARSELIDFAREIKEERRGIISFDPGWDPEGFNEHSREQVFKILEYVDYFEPNEIELVSLLKQRSVKRATLELMKKFDQVLALKMSNRGSLIAQGTIITRIPSFKTKVRDTTGAGDAFDAGFLMGVAQGVSLEERGRLGNAVAALTISNPGDFYHRFPNLREVRSLITHAGRK
jgi:ribokinase